MRKHLAIAFAAWAALTMLGLGLAGWVYFARGDRGIEFLLPRGAWTYSPLIVLAAATAWVLAGCALLLAWRQPPARADRVFYAGLLLLAFLYLNLLREREHFYDLNDYIVAARALHDHQPLPPRYLYPPLLAAALAPLVPLGEPALIALFAAANFAALLLFYGLLWRVLREDGFSSSMAALASLILLAVNVPVQRTLFYGQINLWVADLILLCLVWSERRAAASAGALALAAHLKILPAVFVLPFLLKRKWRWAGWFTLWAVVIGVFVLWAGEGAVYQEFRANIRSAVAAPPETNFRDNSIDSFLRASAYIARQLAHVAIPPAAIAFMIYLAKAVVLGGAVLLLGKQARGGAKGEQQISDGNRKAFVIVSFLMVLLSPVMWEHYPVFLVFPFLALMRVIENPGPRLAWMAAGFLMFAVPTFDFYPFSYSRLAGIIICLPLLVKLCGRGREEHIDLKFEI